MSNGTGPIRISNATPPSPLKTPIILASVSSSAKNSAPISTPIIGVVALKIAE